MEVGHQPVVSIAVPVATVVVPAPTVPTRDDRLVYGFLVFCVVMAFAFGTLAWMTTRRR